VFHGFPVFFLLKIVRDFSFPVVFRWDTVELERNPARTRWCSGLILRSGFVGNRPNPVRGFLAWITASIFRVFFGRFRRAESSTRVVPEAFFLYLLDIAVYDAFIIYRIRNDISSHLSYFRLGIITDVLTKINYSERQLVFP
jgi:hypothetical protein